MQLLFELWRFVIIALASSGAAAIVFAALLLDYMERSNNDMATKDLPPTAIVFTGQYDRIHLGLALLTEGRIDQLFITGVNSGAGLSVERFATQFDLSDTQSTWLESGKIVLAADAESTFENAWEAGCWLRQNPGIDAITLITSQSHMARASIALKNEIRPIKITRVFSDPDPERDPMLLDMEAFSEYVATWSITLLPHRLWPANEPNMCK